VQQKLNTALSYRKCCNAGVSPPPIAGAQTSYDTFVANGDGSPHRPRTAPRRGAPAPGDVANEINRVARFRVREQILVRASRSPADQFAQSLIKAERRTPK
jgi:hypothetical protein